MLFKNLGKYLNHLIHSHIYAFNAHQVQKATKILIKHMKPPILRKLLKETFQQFISNPNSSSLIYCCP